MSKAFYYSLKSVILFVSVFIQSCTNSKEDGKSMLLKDSTSVYQYDVSSLYNSISNDNEFYSFWNNFRNLIKSNDTNELSELVTDYFVCGNCYKEGTFDYLDSALISKEDLLNSHYQNIFTENLITRLYDSTKIILNDDLQNDWDYKGLMKTKSKIEKKTVKNICILTLDPSKTTEGAQACLSFVKVNGSYRFYSYFTIP